MIKEFKIIGDFIQSTTVQIDINESPLEILRELNIDMGLSGKIIAVQIGGVLGEIAFGSQMLEPIKNRLNENSANYIMFFGNLFCPVDYLRFLSRFLIREIRIETDEARYLNTCIEDITLKGTKHNSIRKIEEALSDLGDTYAEKRIIKLYYQIIERYKKIILEHINDKYCKTGICRTLFVAQCINACPAAVHIPGYIALMKKNDIESAYYLMRKTNPLSLICGKICARPCESRCRRKEIENTVGVRALQKYISLQALSNSNFNEDKLQYNGKTIGIIGAGPAGLTAAYYLQRSGYQVEIYEELNKAGGILASCVPAYRMPDKDLDLEIESITKLGVNIRYGCSVGKDILMKEVQESHNAVIIATGAKQGKQLKNLVSENTITAVDFLKSVRLENVNQISENVVVFGGGDVAVDAARTALRLGAKTVILVSLETFENMPSNYEEKEFAIKEGVRFENGWNINKYENSKIELAKCKAVTDLDGVFAPVVSQNEVKELYANTLILAIGQYPDLGFLTENYKIHKGLIGVDEYTFETSVKNVYAIGDVVQNGIAIKAIAEGKKVAKKIDEHLGGTGLYLGEEIEIPEEPLSITTWDDQICEEKISLVKDIKGNFDEVLEVFNKSDAMYEANRCMRCDRNSIQPLWIRPKNNI